MSELINNAAKRKELLKHMILQLHKGEAPEEVRKQLVRIMGQVPYNEVVEVEQELINEGLPQEEVLRLCDIHTAALEGAIDQSGAATAPPGHPVDTFREENKALRWEIEKIGKLLDELDALADDAPAADILTGLRGKFHNLMDVEKHYLRKENLLFPFLEQHGITGPPTVMWGKHDETRELLKTADEALAQGGSLAAGEARAAAELLFRPAMEAVSGMIMKEEEILFPMTLDTLTDEEWYEIDRQSLEIGFCLYDPKATWRPEGIEVPAAEAGEGGRIQLPSGSFTLPELTTLLNTIPFDMTFVDQDDTVRFFTQGRERIFGRSRAILGRKVQHCHPPSSVHMVEKILDDFHAGREEHCRFWITLGGRFIIIEYFAMRGTDGTYLGTLEVSQDLTEKRALEGEQRLLSYSSDKGGE
jgi:DUF438 domain-containing protein